jgi:type IV secretory pathway TraG/TraD family ATPase VirD4
MSTPQIADSWALETPMLALSRHPSDKLTLEDLLTGVLILGNTGSGKTSSSSREIAEAMLEHGWGGLVLCAKRSEADRWKRLLEKTGRASDGRFFSVGQPGEEPPYRFNFLAQAAAGASVDFVRNVTQLLSALAFVPQGSERLAGSDSFFWKPQLEKFIGMALTTLILAKEPVEFLHLYKILTTSPKDGQEAESRDWKKDSYLSRLLDRCPAGQGLERLRFYWLTEWATLEPDTRSVVVACVTALLDPLSYGAIGALFSGQTTLSPTDILDGKIVVVDVPERVYREVARTCARIWKLTLQRALDARDYRPPETRPVFLFQDEGHLFAAPSDDHEFQSTARSQGVCNVLICQNYALLATAYGSRDVADSLLANFVLKILHRNDAGTNRWASDLIATESRYRHSISGNQKDGTPQLSVSEAKEESCPPSEFLNLKNGGLRNRYLTEAIVFASGRQWLGGRLRWARRTFSQR